MDEQEIKRIERELAERWGGSPIELGDYAARTLVEVLERLRSQNRRRALRNAA